MANSAVDHAAVQEAEVRGPGGNGDVAGGVDQFVERRRGPPLEPAGVARVVFADGVHDAVSLKPRGKHLGDQFRRMLQVGVHHDHRVAPGELQARADGALVAEVPRQADDLDPRVLAGELAKDGHRIVLAAVVDEEDLVGKAGRGWLPAGRRRAFERIHVPAYRLVEGTEVPGLVEHGDNDGDGA